MSRNSRDHTRRFADLADAIAKLSARSLVLDGEVAIYDEQLRSRFDWLREPDPDAVATPPVFMAFDLFDLLYRDGRDLAPRPAGGCRRRQPVGFPRAAARDERGWMRGDRWSSAGTKATSPRTRPACTRAGRRGGG